MSFRDPRECLCCGWERLAARRERINGPTGSKRGAKEGQRSERTDHSKDLGRHFPISPRTTLCHCSPGSLHDILPHQSPTVHLLDPLTDPVRQSAEETTKPRPPPAPAVVSLSNRLSPPSPHLLLVIVDGLVPTAGIPDDPPNAKASPSVSSRTRHWRSCPG
jgi:hypothetical protein